MADAHNQQVLDVINRIADGIKSILNSDDKFWNKIKKMAEVVTPEVEEIGQGWKGSDKKSLAHDIILDMWFKYANIKYLPDWLEQKIVSKIADVLIDNVVDIFNKKGIFVHKSN